MALIRLKPRHPQHWAPFSGLQVREIFFLCLSWVTDAVDVPWPHGLVLLSSTFGHVFSEENAVTVIL